MRFISKVLKDSLHEKFPDATEDELLKVCIQADEIPKESWISCGTDTNFTVTLSWRSCFLIST